MRSSAWELALRRDRRCCAVSCGKRGSKLATRADAELGEDLSQVVGDGGGADEQLRGCQRLLIATRLLYSTWPCTEAQSLTLTPALYVVGGGLDQLSGLCFPASYAAPDADAD